MKLLGVCSSSQYNYLWAIKYCWNYFIWMQCPKIIFYTCIFKESVFSFCFSLSTKKMRSSSAELSSSWEMLCTSGGSGSVTKRKVNFLVKAMPAANGQRLRMWFSSRIDFHTDNCNGAQIIKIVLGTENKSLIQVWCLLFPVAQVLTPHIQLVRIWILADSFCFGTTDKIISSFIAY